MYHGAIISHTFINQPPFFNNMRDFSPEKRKRFGGRNSGGSGSRFERRDSDRSDSRSGSRFERRGSDRSDNRSGSRFERRDSNRSDRGDSRSDNKFHSSDEFRTSKFERHTVTCDSCGKRCEVPFKPTSNKPVYCSDCFKNNSRAGPMIKSQQQTEELDQINDKLDKIMKALQIE